MRRLALFDVWILVLLATASPVSAEGPRGAAKPESRPAAPADWTPATVTVVGSAGDGLKLRRPYARGKVPVVFIHGLWATTRSWNGMIEALEADPGVSAHYQFWTFGYATGDPIPYSASRLRQSLAAARRRFDADHSERSFDRIVLVGHSMGGLVAKMLVVDSGTRLWSEVSDRPFDKLAGDPADRMVLGDALFFKALPEVRSVVFVATPHRGGRICQGWLQRLGLRLVRPSEPLRAACERLITGNDPRFFNEAFCKRLPSSIEELEWDAPFLKSLGELPVSRDVKLHSIIAVRPDRRELERSDGLVSYASAHLESAGSEIVVAASHLCQDDPGVIREVRQILGEQMAP